MAFFRFLNQLKFISRSRLLELYPPFWFMGVKLIKLTNDYRELHLVLPLRWYGKNLHGTMFGGFICAVSDPLLALMCEKIFPGISAWTKSHYVDFLRPAKSDLVLRAMVTKKDVRTIRQSLKNNRRATHSFEFYFYDSNEHKVARVINTVFLRPQNARMRKKIV